jgi:acyl-CoA synthetase (AMP-forming)/AMP-acid ligase II
MSSEATLLHELVGVSAGRAGSSPALTFGAETLAYGDLARRVDAFAAGLRALGLERADRVGIYLDKRLESVIACFGTTAAGGVFVPLNPLLKPEQVAHILRDCNARVLLTSPERLAIFPQSSAVPDLRHAITAGDGRRRDRASTPSRGANSRRAAAAGHRVIDTDMAAILYTSGSTGMPKGVVLSHRNMVTGAKSVASYLENRPDDTLLAVLPMSFDAGPIMTTGFHASARRPDQLPAPAGCHQCARQSA